MDEPGKIIHSVDKAAELIEILMRNRVPLTLREIAALSGYPKSTIHGLLNTLIAHEMIRQDAEGRYSLGIRLYECGRAVSSGWDISERTHPYIERLSASVDAGAFIAYFDGANVITIDRCTGGGSLQIIPESGVRQPLHATAQGKLFLSTLPQKDALRLARLKGMDQYTPHTINTPEDLAADLSAIRIRGYAIEDGEHRVGLRAAAAPLRIGDSRIKYAVGIIGLFRRVSSDEFQSACGELLKTAEEMEKEIGGRGI